MDHGLGHDTTVHVLTWRHRARVELCGHAASAEGAVLPNTPPRSSQRRDGATSPTEQKRSVPSKSEHSISVGTRPSSSKLRRGISAACKRSAEDQAALLASTLRSRRLSCKTPYALPVMRLRRALGERRKLLHALLQVVLARFPHGLHRQRSLSQRHHGAKQEARERFTSDDRMSTLCTSAGTQQATYSASVPRAAISVAPFYLASKEVAPAAAPDRGNTSPQSVVALPLGDLASSSCASGKFRC